MRVVITDLRTGQKSTEEDVAHLFENPFGDEYLSKPHYHLIYETGFRTNLLMEQYYCKKAAKLSRRRRRTRAKRLRYQFQQKENQ